MERMNYLMMAHNVWIEALVKRAPPYLIPKIKRYANYKMPPYELFREILEEIQNYENLLNT